MTPLLLSLVSASIVSAVDAGEPPSVDDLEGLLDVNVVSGASREQERSDDAPATITVVTADELRRYGLRTLHEAINFVSLGMVAQDPLHSVEVGSRGVLLTVDYGNHMLVVIDGHVMNEQWNGTAYFEQGLGLPLEFIDHVELIVGPGSVLYGSSAMLGVVNVVTKRARDLGSVQVIAEGAAMPPQDVAGAPELRWPGFGGATRLSLLAGHETNLGAHQLEVALAAEYYAHQGQSLTYPVQSGLTEGDSETPQSWGSRAPGVGAWGGQTTDSWKTQVPSAILKVRLGDFSLWARGAIYSRNSPARDEFGVGLDFDGRAREVDRWLNVELRWTKTLSPRLQVMTRAYLDLYDYEWNARSSSWPTFGSSNPLAEELEPGREFDISLKGRSRWGGLESQAIWDWVGDGRFPLMVGVDARLRGFGSATTRSSDDTVLDVANAYSAEEWLVGVYAQQRARVHPRLELNVGARLDVQSSIIPRVSPRVAAVWTLPGEGRLKFILNSAYRAPSGYERFTEFSDQIVNPGLRAESVLTGEATYQHRLGRHRLTLGVFASKYSDMIELALVPPELSDAGDVFWYTNHREILNAGGNARVEGAFGKLRYGLSFTGAINQSERQLVASPGWFGNARVSWEFTATRRLSLAGAFSGSRTITAANATGSDVFGQPVDWDASRRSVGPQTELRTTFETDVPALRGAWIRGVVGAAVTPFSAYTVGPRQAPEPGATTPAQSPNSRLFVGVTVGWSLDPTP